MRVWYWIDLDQGQLLALQNQVERSGVEAASIVCDIVDKERCQQAMREIEDRFGGVDVLVNNAGSWPPQPVSRKPVRL